VLDQHAVLQHGDLCPVAPLPNRHHPIHRFPAGQELRLAEDRRPGAALFPAVAPALVYSRDVDFAVTDGLFGLFRSAHAAKDFLIDTAQAHRLCLVALGLEPATRRGCFGLQLGRCDGVCVGRESAASHALRVAQALAQCAVQRWPFPGAVGLVERDGDWVQTHVVRNWRHERTLDVGGAQDARPPLADPGAGAGFDLDAVKPLLDGGCERIHLED